MTKVTKQVREQAIEYLREQLTEYATRDDRGRPILYFIVKRVAASGMSRVFSTFYVTRDGGAVVGIDHLIARAGIGTATDDGYRVQGCGMDMRFHVCDQLAYVMRVATIAAGNDFAYRSV